MSVSALLRPLAMSAFTPLPGEEQTSERELRRTVYEYTA